MSPAPSSPQAAGGRGATLRLLGIVLFNFAAYACVGLPLAVIPGHVHLELGYGAVVAGLAVSLQYAATLLSRTVAGRLCDRRGPRISVLYGLAACAASGGLLLAAALATHAPAASLSLLLASRLLLGTGESLVTTGTITWGIGALGGAQTAKVISWNGVTTYAALAFAAPAGVWLARHAGLGGLGLATLAIACVALALAWCRQGVAPLPGRPIPARQVFARMLPFGCCLGLASVGFGAITSFVVLYYGDRHWNGAALAISLLGICFVLTRLLLPNAIARHGGFRVAIASLVVEAAGLATLWAAPTAACAALGAAITGVGFALVFPALGIEAVRRVPDSNRGTALGIYSLFLDLALALTGPLAGLLAHHAGYGAIYLVAGLAALAAALASRALAARARAGRVMQGA